MPRSATIRGESYSNGDMYKAGNTSLLEKILSKSLNTSPSTIAMLLASSVPNEISKDPDTSQILIDKLCNTRNQIYHKAFPNSDDILSKHNRYTEQLDFLPYVTFRK